MPLPPLIIPLDTPEATEHLARLIAPSLGPGDVILLDGPVGAGKTHFARAVIHARLGPEEDVPSPTYTLIQTYGSGVEIWHADLYRIAHPDEIPELGLQDAFASAVCLIEWPDRLGPYQPHDPIRIRLIPDGEGRRAEVDAGARPALAHILAADMAARRHAAATGFLRHAGWGDAMRTALAGDASSRRYERLLRNGRPAILMDCPHGSGDDIGDFTRIDRHLRKIGLNAPEILAEDLAQGFLLLEDFGDGVFSRVLAANPNAEVPFYARATDVLLHLQARPPADTLMNLSADDWAAAAGLVCDWYCFAILDDKADCATLTRVLSDCLAKHADGPRVMILRDYHAENLLWLENRSGLQQVGLLDFQLAQLGQPGYDLVSLLQDARRDVSLSVEAMMIRRFIEAKGVQEADFTAHYAAVGAQRALRILGIFARLCLQSGKPGYVDLMPRVWAGLQRCLAHPELRDLAQICERMLPEPGPLQRQRIKDKCGNFP